MLISKLENQEPVADWEHLAQVPFFQLQRTLGGRVFWILPLLSLVYKAEVFPNMKGAG